MDSSLRLSFFFLFSVIDNIGTYQVCTSVPVLEQGLLYWEGASGKRQVTADNVGYNENLRRISLLVLSKSPFKIGSTYRYLTEARQFYSLWYLLSKSGQHHSRLGGFANVGLADNDDRQRADF